jgi:transcriptional regulator with XRE-family HTH domain
MGRHADGFQNELLALGTEVARRRGLAELTQPELAERAGLSLDGLLRVEKARAAPSVVTLLQIAGALGCSPADLFQKAARPSVRLQKVTELLENQPDEVIDAAAACVRAVVKLARGH